MVIILGCLFRIHIFNQISKKIYLAPRIVEQNSGIVGQWAKAVWCHHHCQIGRVHAGGASDAWFGENLEESKEVNQRLLVLGR